MCDRLWESASFGSTSSEMFILQYCPSFSPVLPRFSAYICAEELKKKASMVSSSSLRTSSLTPSSFAPMFPSNQGLASLGSSSVSPSRSSLPSSCPASSTVLPEPVSLPDRRSQRLPATRMIDGEFFYEVGGGYDSDTEIQQVLSEVMFLPDGEV